MTDGRVMVVDEAADIACGLASFLGRHGFEARAASDPGDAVVLAQTWLPDAAVVGMPLANGAGLRLARHLRDSLGPDLRLVAVSPSDAAGERERLRGAGFDRVLARSAAASEMLGALSPPTRELVERAALANARRIEIVIALCETMLALPRTQVGDSYERTRWNVHRLIAILKRDCPCLAPGEARDRLARSIFALELRMRESSAAAAAPRSRI
jgi:CheY-like chemotaxis protein